MYTYTPNIEVGEVCRVESIRRLLETLHILSFSSPHCSITVNSSMENNGTN